MRNKGFNEANQAGGGRKLKDQIIKHSAPIEKDESLFGLGLNEASVSKNGDSIVSQKN